MLKILNIYMYMLISMCRPYLKGTKKKNKKKGTLTTFFLLVGKLPFDFTIMVHSLTSSGWVHLVEKKNSCVRP